VRELVNIPCALGENVHFGIVSGISVNANKVELSANFAQILYVLIYLLTLFFYELLSEKC
jgi:hypothetical protein